MKINSSAPESKAMLTQPWVLEVRVPANRADDASEFVWEKIPDLQGIEESPLDGTGIFRSEKGMDILEFGTPAAEAADEFLRTEEFRGSSQIILKLFVSGETRGGEEQWREILSSFDSPISLDRVYRLPTTDYLEAYKKGVRGVRFGRQQNLWVGPPWECKAPDNCLAFWVEPAMAFGTGEHPTTQMCVERLWELKDAGAIPSHILDLGTGTGLLAVVCRILFPQAHIVALDTDPLCEESFLRTCELNGLNSKDFVLGFGPREGDIRLLPESSRFDLVVSNIYAEVLAKLAGEIQNRFRGAGSRWIASGILEGESDRALVSVIPPTLSCLEERRHLRKGPDGKEEFWKLYEWHFHPCK